MSGSRTFLESRGEYLSSKSYDKGLALASVFARVRGSHE